MHETKKYVGAGQMGRPFLNDLSFDSQAPTSFLGLLRAVVLGFLGAVVVVAVARVVSEARVRLIARIWAAYRSATSAASGAPETLPSPAMQGSWAAAGFRPAYLVKKILAARRARALRARLWPLGARTPFLLTRLAQDWDLQCRAYVAAWGVYQEAYIDALPKRCTTPIGARIAENSAKKSGLSTRCVRRVADRIQGRTLEDRLAPLWSGTDAEVASKTQRKEWRF